MEDEFAPFTAYISQFALERGILEIEVVNAGNGWARETDNRVRLQCYAPGDWRPTKAGAVVKRRSAKAKILSFKRQPRHGSFELGTRRKAALSVGFYV